MKLRKNLGTIAGMFKPVSPKVEFPKLEEETLTYWKENKIFEKSVQMRPDDKRWTFLDGPPFVTGMPHYGSLLSSLPKDVFGRYWTMKGYKVRRVWGWDGHGLPIENKVENKLDIKRKRDIEEVVGIKTFVDECKQYVNQVSGEWEWYIDRIGRWVDFKNAYKTWDLDYMESVMWVFKQMYDKELIYKGLRVTLYCPHCATPISNFEVAMDADNYKDLSDPATTYKYEVEGEENTYFLAWSTTPWTKIVTPALAVNPDLPYVKVLQNKEKYILAKSTLKVLGDESTYTILEEINGKDLLGKKYVPHYDYYNKHIKPGEKVFEVIPGNFVTADEGTGIVTMAAFGIEDLQAMKENNIHVPIHLDEEGHVFKDIPQFGGMYYLKANTAVNEDLTKRNLIYETKDYTHSVPLCWRCHTRLYYAPIDAWYVNVQVLKPLMKKTNGEVNWFPNHFKQGRFLKSLENAPDWNISRNRYWGSPVPVWECQGCGERFVPGSIKELEEASGQKVTDLHRPEIDEITVPCKKCGKKAHRVQEVLDSWIEAGSASFAERHYPFSTSKNGAHAEKLEDFFPPDYIAEYTGQIRAWFYVLHVIGAALYESKAYKNVQVTGVILGTDGRKMSKNFGNYPDPKLLLETYGGDGLRLYLLGSPVMHGEDIIISEEQYKNQVKGTMLILWNSYNFFISYANMDNWKHSESPLESENVLDTWILSLLNSLIKQVTTDLDSYDTVTAISHIQQFVADFSTWYIRRSRDRVGPSAQDETDKNNFYETSYSVLTTLSQVLAPIAPFISEEMYRNLTSKESVHLTDFPKENSKRIDVKLEEQMVLVRKIAELGHAKRKELQLKVKQPLHAITVTNIPEILNEKLSKVLLEELNIKKIIQNKGDKEPFVELDTTLTEELKKEGEVRELVRKIQEERKKLGTKMDELVNVTLPHWPEEFENEIKRKALIQVLTKGDQFEVRRP